MHLYVYDSVQGALKDGSMEAPKKKVFCPSKFGSGLNNVYKAYVREDSLESLTCYQTL